VARRLPAARIESAGCENPSKWQTRQPIYRTSVARWRRYEPWLGPLRALVDDKSELDAGTARS